MAKWLRGESTSPAKQQTNACISCNESTTDDSLECVWCERLQHRTCAKISDDQYCVLVNFPSNIVFFCESCFYKLPGALFVYDKSEELTSSIDKKLKSLETQLSSKYDGLSDRVNKVAKDNQIKAIESQLSKSNKQYQAAFSDLTAKVAALAKDITFNSTQLTSLKSNFEELNKKESLVMDTEEGVTSDTGGSFTNESVATITVGVVDEQREREKRKLNLVLHNVPESTKQSGPERKADDISKVEKLLHDHLGINPTISNAIRLGKKSDRPRLLKISVATIQEKSTILRNCYKLRNNSNPESVKTIFATSDLTPLEQKKDKVLRQKLAKMNKDDKVYKIKNGVIVRRA